MTNTDSGRLLQAILANVAFDGWTNRSLRDAARREGVSAGQLDVLFPGGARSVLAAFSDWADDQMLAAVAADADGFRELRVRDKIAFLVEARLDVLEPHKEAVRRSLAVLAAPSNAGLASRLLYSAVDAMWRAAGDTSTDYNFYTKRALLAGVYASTQLYWLNDRSHDHADSRAFLARRIGEVLTVGRRMGGVIDKIGKVGEAPFRLAGTLRDRQAQARRSRTQPG